MTEFMKSGVTEFMYYVIRKGSKYYFGGYGGVPVFLSRGETVLDFVCPKKLRDVVKSNVRKWDTLEEVEGAILELRGLGIRGIRYDVLV